MTARLRRFAGPFLMLVGALIMAWPLISVARIGPEMLAELPDAGDEFIVDHTVGWIAIRSDDFVVARRSYPAMSKEEVLDLYRSSPFQSNGVDSFSKVCCGDYDAVFVTITSSEAGTIQAELTPADSDIQLSWPFIVFVGAVVTAAGLLAVVLVRHSKGQAIGATPRPIQDDRQQA